MTNLCIFNGFKFGLEEIHVIAFYYPGYPTPADIIFKCSFLSNFYEYPFIHDGLEFLTAEGAYQSEKFPDKKHLFQNITGNEAYKLSRSLSSTTVFNSAQVWDIMYGVLKSKFDDKSDQPYNLLHKLLQDTNNSFLLEHNIVKGRDSRWSDDYDGTGTNWLGLLLMIIRDEQKPFKHQYWTTWIKNHINIHDGSLYLNSYWQNLVMVACDTLNSILKLEPKLSISQKPILKLDRITSSIVDSNYPITLSNKCTRPGCPYTKYKEYSFCSMICAQASTSRICNRQGCLYLKYRNQYHEYSFCSKICEKAVTSHLCARPGCTYQRYRNSNREFLFCSQQCAQESIPKICARPGCQYLKYKNQYREFAFCSQECAQKAKHICI